MRVVMIHNRYRAPGGEERAVADISALLESHGHEVHLLERDSGQVSRRQAARGLLTGGLAPDDIARTVHRTRAEIVHAHNLHPSFGWRALAAGQAAGARTVLHLHNFRLFCAIAIAYRDGAPCFRCRGANTLPGLALRCRGSVAEAAAYAAGLHLQQPRLYQHTDRFIVLSHATGARLHQLGLPASHADVLANFIPDRGFATASQAHEGRYALAVGRLVAEKGFDVAVRAARAASVPLVIAGAGPDEPRLRDLARGADVRFTGWLASGELARLRAGAAVALVPSRWEEHCPFTVLDAMAAGVPVLASDIGGIRERVVPESAIAVDDYSGWAGALSALWRDPGLRRHRGDDGLALARATLSAGRYYEQLMSIYGVS